MTKTSKITYTAVFAAIATVLMYFEFPIPFMPPFLKVDLSGAVVLIGAFIFGIGPAIVPQLRLQDGLQHGQIRHGQGIASQVNHGQSPSSRRNVQKMFVFR